MEDPPDPYRPAGQSVQASAFEVLLNLPAGQEAPVEVAPRPQGAGKKKPGPAPQAPEQFDEVEPPVP